VVNKDNRHHKDNNVNLGWSNNLGRKIEYSKLAVQNVRKTTVHLYSAVQEMSLDHLLAHNPVNALSVVTAEEKDDRFII
jgi:hypothetical protein